MAQQKLFWVCLVTVLYLLGSIAAVPVYSRERRSVQDTSNTGNTIRDDGNQNSEHDLAIGVDDSPALDVDTTGIADPLTSNVDGVDQSGQPSQALETAQGSDNGQPGSDNVFDPDSLNTGGALSGAARSGTALDTDEGVGDTGRVAIDGNDGSLENRNGDIEGVEPEPDSNRDSDGHPGQGISGNSHLDRAGARRGVDEFNERNGTGTFESHFLLTEHEGNGNRENPDTGSLGSQGSEVITGGNPNEQIHGGDEHTDEHLPLVQPTTPGEFDRNRQNGVATLAASTRLPNNTHGIQGGINNHGEGTDNGENIHHSGDGEPTHETNGGTGEHLQPSSEHATGGQLNPDGGYVIHEGSGSSHNEGNGGGGISIDKDEGNRPSRGGDEHGASSALSEPFTPRLEILPTPAQNENFENSTFQTTTPHSIIEGQGEIHSSGDNPGEGHPGGEPTDLHPEGPHGGGHIISGEGHIGTGGDIHEGSGHETLPEGSGAHEETGEHKENSKEGRYSSTTLGQEMHRPTLIPVTNPESSRTILFPSSSIEPLTTETSQRYSSIPTESESTPLLSSTMSSSPIIDTTHEPATSIEPSYGFATDNVPYSMYEIESIKPGGLDTSETTSSYEGQTTSLSSLPLSSSLPHETTHPDNLHSSSVTPSSPLENSITEIRFTQLESSISPTLSTTLSPSAVVVTPSETQSTTLSSTPETEPTPSPTSSTSSKTLLRSTTTTERISSPFNEPSIGSTTSVTANTTSPTTDSSVPPSHTSTDTTLPSGDWSTSSSLPVRETSTMSASSTTISTRRTSSTTTTTTEGTTTWPFTFTTSRQTRSSTRIPTTQTDTLISRKETPGTSTETPRLSTETPKTSTETPRTSTETPMTSTEPRRTSSSGTTRGVPVMTFASTRLTTGTSGTTRHAANKTMHTDMSTAGSPTTTREAPVLTFASTERPRFRSTIADYTTLIMATTKKTATQKSTEKPPVGFTSTTTQAGSSTHLQRNTSSRQNGSAAAETVTLPLTSARSTVTTVLTPVTQKTQNPEVSTPPPLFIQIEIRMTWREFCSKKPNFIASLQEIIHSEKQKIVRDEQIRIPNLPHQYCRLNNLLDVNEQAVGSIHVQMYIVDMAGKVDIQLTLDASTVLGKGFPDAGFKGKILDVKVVQPGDDRQRAESIPRSHQRESGITMVIVIASVGGFCCLMLIMLQVVLIHRRVKAKAKLRSPQPKQGSSTSGGSNDNVALGAIPKSRPSSGYWNPALEEEEAFAPFEYSHMLNYSTLANTCVDVSAIHEEFQKIPCENSGLTKLFVGEDDKNRFANVLPHSHSRVKLVKREGDTSDYINASYIKGYRGDADTYIATQSPLVNTVEDFWRMVWEQQSRIIIMMNPRLPSGKYKQSTCYWPDNESLDAIREYGDFTVNLKKRTVHKDYTECALEITDIERNLKRDVHHFLLTCWPDAGRPEPLSIIKFVLDTRPYYEDVGGPPIIHCGPGTGRTGTLIAVDMCMRMYEARKHVDFLNCVYKMRKDRLGMVQTKEQYAIVYQALNEYAVILGSPSISSRSSVITLHAML